MRIMLVNQRLPRLKALLLVVLILSGAFYFNWYFKTSRRDKIQADAAWQERESTMKDLNESLKRLANEVKAFQGKSKCRTDSECHVVGIGTRVCNEYKNYIIYSSRDTNEQILLNTISAFNETHKKTSALSLAAESCGVKPASVQCVQGHCVPITH